MKGKHVYKSSFKRYLRRTYKNKLCALAMFIVGLLTMKITGNGLFMLYVLVFALPTFFTKEKWIV